jgi:hypothetical protein
MNNGQIDYGTFWLRRIFTATHFRDKVHDAITSDTYTKHILI